VKPPSSTTPYMLRALYEWCLDNGLTPHVLVRVDDNTRVPSEFVKNGEIVLNISPTAARALTMDNDWVRFSARFGGVSREVIIPMQAVAGIFARENGQGMTFKQDGGSGVSEERKTTGAPQDETDQPPPRGKPKLQVVK
jgi:stringent starvation protein B